MSFVSVPAPNAPADPPVTIEHDSFFPGIALGTLRDLERIPTAVTDARLKAAAIGAMLTVGKELAAWKAAQLEAGNDTLADVSDETVAGQPRLVALYERAVSSHAAADLADTHHDISASADGKDRIDERALTVDEHRRNATHAIRDILGVSRTAVELI